MFIHDDGRAEVFGADVLVVSPEPPHCGLGVARERLEDSKGCGIDRGK